MPALLLLVLGLSTLQACVPAPAPSPKQDLREMMEIVRELRAPAAAHAPVPAAVTAEDLKEVLGILRDLDARVRWLESARTSGSRAP